jgi:Asp-tRNA(Asn)/Glu-tRNA(Gln) amidotransferase A subunit family amidase
MSDAPWRLSPCELAQGIRDRRFPCVEVVESVVARNADRNTYLTAIVHGYFERALVAARERTRRG